MHAFSVTSETMLQCDTTSSARGESGQQPLNVATTTARATDNNIQLLGSLLRRGADADERSPCDVQHCSYDRQFESCRSNFALPLGDAPRRNYADLVQRLADSATVDGAGNTAPHCAVVDSQRTDDDLSFRSHSLAVLTERGANINAANADGSTALYEATAKQCRHAVRELLQRGADPNVATSNDYPLCLALRAGADELAEILLTGGADPDLASPSASCDRPSLPLFIAVSTGNCNAVRALLKHGATVDLYDTIGGQTALQFAVSCTVQDRNDDRRPEMIEIVRELLQSGADCNAATASGRTPLSTAVEHLNDFITGIHNVAAGVSYAAVTMSEECKTSVVELISELVRHGATMNVDFSGSAEQTVALNNFSIPSNTRRELINLFMSGAGLRLMSICCGVERAFSLMRQPTDMSIRLCQAVILAGYRIRPQDLRNADQLLSETSRLQLLRWLREDLTNAPSLSRQCRNVIRRQLLASSGQRTILPLIHRLPVPGLIKRYLTFEDEFAEDDFPVSTVE